MQVVVYKNRGAIVPHPEEFVRGHEECVTVPLDGVVNMEVYEFKCTFKGLPANKWAEFWLKKGDKRARNAGSLVPVPYLLKESKITGRACKKAFLKSTKRYKKTKIKSIGNLSSSAIL